MEYYFQCPKCGKNERFSVASIESGNLGCLLFFLGGLLPALLYADRTRSLVQCADCGHVFRQPPLPGSPLSKLSGWIFLVLAAFAFLGLLMIEEPEVASAIPRFEWLTGIETAIGKNPYAVAFCLVAATAILLSTAMLAAIAANWKFRSRFKKEYRTKPDPCPERGKR